MVLLYNIAFVHVSNQNLDFDVLVFKKTYMFCSGYFLFLFSKLRNAKVNMFFFWKIKYESMVEI